MPFWRSDWFLAESGTQLNVFEVLLTPDIQNVQIDTQITDLSSWVDPVDLVTMTCDIDTTDIDRPWWTQGLVKMSTHRTVEDHWLRFRPGDTALWWERRCLSYFNNPGCEVFVLAAEKIFQVGRPNACNRHSSFDTAFSKAAVLRRTQIPSLEVWLGWWAKHNRRREYCVARTLGQQQASAATSIAFRMQLELSLWSRLPGCCGQLWLAAVGWACSCRRLI